jgi:hypothetical protein
MVRSANERNDDAHLPGGRAEIRACGDPGVRTSLSSGYTTGGWKRDPLTGPRGGANLRTLQSRSSRQLFCTIRDEQ